jgi:hypothetical protein
MRFLQASGMLLVINECWRGMWLVATFPNAGMNPRAAGMSECRHVAGTGDKIAGATAELQSSACPQFSGSSFTMEAP